MAAEVGSAFVSIIPSLKGFSAKLRAELAGELRTIDPVVSQAGTRAGHTFGSSMSTALTGAITKIGTLLKTGLLIGASAAAAGLGALTLFGLKSAASLEQVSIGLEALIGNAQDAKKFMGELQDFAAKTPFEFAGVADASRRILAFGQSVGIAREQVIPTLTTIGDLVSVLGGTQESVDAVVRAFGQIASKGRLQGDEILQLSEALPGFNANAAIAAHLGVSVADMLDLQAAGAIDAKTAIDGLLEGMAAFPGAAGAMAKQAETLKGVFSTFKDTIAIALTNAFQPVIPAIKTSLTEITPILGASLDKLAPALGGLVAAFLPLLGILTQALTPVLIPVLEAIGALIPQITPDLKPLGEAFGEIIAAVAPLAPELGKLASELIAAIIPSLHEWAPLLPPLIESMIRLTTALLPLIPPLTDLLILFANMSAANIELLTGAIDQFVFILTFLQSLDVAGIWHSINDAFHSGVEAIGTFFSELPGKIGAFLSGLPAQLGNLAKDAFNAFAFAVGFGIGTIIKFFIDLPGNIGALVTTLWTNVKALFTSGVEDTKNTAIGGFNRFLDFVRGLPGQVIGALSSLPGQLLAFGSNLAGQMYGVGQSIVYGAINGIRSVIGNLINTLRDAFSSAVAGVKRGLGIGSPSKVFAEVGKDSIAGYVKGIEDSAAMAAQVTLGAIQPGAAASPAAAPRPQPVEVRSDDPFIQMAIQHMKEAVRTTYGGNVEFALGTS